MAREIGARCGHNPDPATAARVAGVIMRAALGQPGTETTVVHHEESWDVRWSDTALAIAIPVEPGCHEFGEEWFLFVHPGPDDMDLQLLLAIVVATSAALTTNGLVFDDRSVLEGGTDYDGAKQHDPATLLDRLLVSGPRDPSTALRALKVTVGFIEDN